MEQTEYSEKNEKWKQWIAFIVTGGAIGFIILAGLSFLNASDNQTFNFSYFYSNIFNYCFLFIFFPAGAASIAHHISKDKGRITFRHYFLGSSTALCLIMSIEIISRYIGADKSMQHTLLIVALLLFLGIILISALGGLIFDRISSFLEQ